MVDFVISRLLMWFLLKCGAKNSHLVYELYNILEPLMIFI